MLQDIALIGSHSLSYAYDSLYMAYLKSHYPLEFYTVSLNFYQGDFERTNRLTQELKYFNIKLSNPKFRYSFGEYSCDKTTKTIYKGISSIKGLSKTLGDKLYTLKDKTYPTFFDLLIDSKENSIGIADLTILIKLDYFSEFGSIGKLLKFVEIYNELYGKKILKKDKEYSVKLLYLKQFCSKETEKQYSGFDSISCLRSLFDKIEDKDISIREKINYQLQYYGYTNITDEKTPREYWVATDVSDRGKNKFVDLYQINTGNKFKVKIRGSVFSQNPFQIGSILQILSFNKEGKWIKNSETQEWEKSKTIFEDILNNYKLCENF